MKKILLVLVILFFTSYCCQKMTNQRQEISQRYVDGKKKILHKYSGKGEFEKLIEIVTYNKAGKIVEEKNLAAQTKRMIWWHKNGMRKTEIRYTKGKKHGTWLEWYSNGLIKKEKVYCRGKLVRQANYKRYIIEETIYKEGKLFMIREYKDGIIVTEKTYQGGKLKKNLWFYPDGKISDERGYKDGKKHGRWVHWDKNGEIRQEEFYQDGELVN